MGRRIGGIDPQVGWCGYGVFEDDGTRYELNAAGLFVNIGPYDIADRVSRLELDVAHVEYPQQYRIGVNKADPQDLLVLALVSGSAASGCKESHLWQPRQWKGTRSKEVHHNQLRCRLSADEERLLDHALKPLSKKKRLDVLDGVALAAWAAGRLN